MGTHACTQPQRDTHADTPAADHRDLISYCHNTFISHLFLWAVMSKRLLSAAKWAPHCVFHPPLMERNGMGPGHLYLWPCPNRADLPENSPAVSSP